MIQVWRKKEKSNSQRWKTTSQCPSYNTYTTEKDSINEIKAELKKLASKLCRYKGTEVKSYQTQTKKVTHKTQTKHDF